MRDGDLVGALAHNHTRVLAHNLTRALAHNPLAFILRPRDSGA